MTAEIVRQQPTGHTLPSCAAQGCDRPAHGYRDRWCTPHRRGLTLSTALTDALVSFLALAGDAPEYDERVVVAGELIQVALELLLGSAFNSDDVVVEERPIKFKDSVDTEKVRWRVSLGWLAG